jgi:hypothetical protein
MYIYPQVMIIQPSSMATNILILNIKQIQVRKMYINILSNSFVQVVDCSFFYIYLGNPWWTQIMVNFPDVKEKNMLRISKKKDAPK